MKLTKQQNMVINCLQNGWVIITDSEYPGAWVGNSSYQFKIVGRLFWNLVEKGLIFQDHGHGFGHHWNYILTDEGKGIKTKDIQQDIVDSLTSIK